MMSLQPAGDSGIATTAEIAAQHHCALWDSIAHCAGHSFTALVPTEGTLISLERMNRLLDVELRRSGHAEEATSNRSALHAYLEEVVLVKHGPGRLAARPSLPCTDSDSQPVSEPPCRIEPED